MAKQKKSPAPKKGKGDKGKKTAGRRGAAAGPRQLAIKGMGQVRNKKLDRLCEQIGEARDAKNKAIADEIGDAQASLREMQDKSIPRYTHAGVELILRHGADKLSIKLLKDKTAEGAAAPAEGGESEDLGGGDTGSAEPADIENNDELG